MSQLEQRVQSIEKALSDIHSELRRLKLRDASDIDSISFRRFMRNVESALRNIRP